ncbi:MAG: hypothetical protein HQK50_00305 [Oligoflexia bacterium]|nr:hypothetical protein [Oligoflexia bacterium]MBF0363976.1 hypothetical protein [Oligoflexia bacterium]
MIKLSRLLLTTLLIVILTSTITIFANPGEDDLKCPSHPQLFDNQIQVLLPIVNSNSDQSDSRRPPADNKLNLSCLENNLSEHTLKDLLAQDLPFAERVLMGTTLDPTCYDGPVAGDAKIELLAQKSDQLGQQAEKLAQALIEIEAWDSVPPQAKKKAAKAVKKIEQQLEKWKKREQLSPADVEKKARRQEELSVARLKEAGDLLALKEELQKQLFRAKEYDLQLESELLGAQRESFAMAQERLRYEYQRPSLQELASSLNSEQKNIKVSFYHLDPFDQGHQNTDGVRELVLESEKFKIKHLSTNGAVNSVWTVCEAANSFCDSKATASASSPLERSLSTSVVKIKQNKKWDNIKSLRSELILSRLLHAYSKKFCYYSLQDPNNCIPLISNVPYQTKYLGNGILQQDLIEGPTAQELHQELKLLQELPAGNNGSEEKKLLEKFHAWGFQGNKEQIIQDVDRHLKLLQLFYAETRADIIKLSKYCNLESRFNFPVTMKAVGFDFNHGSNAKWDPQSKKFRIFDP